MNARHFCQDRGAEPFPSESVNGERHAWPGAQHGLHLTPDGEVDGVEGGDGGERRARALVRPGALGAQRATRCAAPRRQVLGHVTHLRRTRFASFSGCC